MTLTERINEIKKQGYEYEVFEGVNDTIVLQEWPNTSMVMYEYTFTPEEMPLEGWVHTVEIDWINVQKLF